MMAGWFLRSRMHGIVPELKYMKALGMISQTHSYQSISTEAFPPRANSWRVLSRLTTSRLKL